MNRPAIARRRVLAWSAVFGYSGLAFTLVRNLLFVPIYLRFIELGEYGAWLATGGALVQLLVTDFGLAGVITQRIAAHAGAGDRAAMGALTRAGLVNATLLALIFTAIGSLLAWALPATQGLTPGQVTRVTHCFVIALAANGVGVISLAALAAVRGAQRPIAAGGAVLAADLVGVLLTLGLLFGGLGLYSIAWGLLARSAVTALMGLVLLMSGPGTMAATRTTRWFADSLALWRDAGRFFATSVAMRLQSQANILVVGMLLGPHSAAVYGLTVRAHETVNIVFSQLNLAFGPVLAHLVGAGQVGRLGDVIRSLLTVVAALAALGAIGVAVLNEPFMNLWVGSDMFDGFQLTVLMAVAMWMTSVCFVGYEALLARGEFAFIARTFAGASVVHLVVLVAVVSAWGAWAAPLAICASSACWGWVFWRRVARDTTRDAPAGLLREPALIGLIAAAVMVLLLVARPPITGWAGLCLAALVCTALGALVLLIARPPLRHLLRTEFVSTLRALRAA